MVWLLVLWTARISHDGFDDKVQICVKKLVEKYSTIQDASSMVRAVVALK